MDASAKLKTQREQDLGAGSDPIATSERTIADGACDVEAAVYVWQAAISEERPPHATS
jgi:hypothetical protein